LKKRKFVPAQAPRGLFKAWVLVLTGVENEFRIWVPDKDILGSPLRYEDLRFATRVKFVSGDGPQITTFWGLRFSARICDEQRRRCLVFNFNPQGRVFSFELEEFSAKD